MSNDMSNDMSYESPSAAIMKTTTPYTSVLYNMNSIAFTRMTTVFDDRTGNNDLDLYFYTVFDGCTGNNDGISSAAIADKAQYDCYDGDTAVSRASPSIATDPKSSIVIDPESSSVSVASNEASSACSDSPATVKTTTQVYSSSSSSSYFELSAIYDEDSSVKTTSPSVSIADEAISSVTLSTRDFDIALKTYDTVYDSYFDSYDIDSSSSSAAVTIMTTVFDGRTGDNDFDLHFDSVATFILILTSLMLVIVLIHISILSLVDVYSSYDVYCTSGECVVVRKWVQSPEWRFP